MLILAAEERTLPEEIGPTQIAPNWQIQNCLDLTEVGRLWELAEAKYCVEVWRRCERGVTAGILYFCMGLADWSVFAKPRLVTVTVKRSHYLRGKNRTSLQLSGREL
jgi:hypothetical protein